MWAVAPGERFAENRIVDSLCKGAIRPIGCNEAADHVIKGELEMAQTICEKYKVPPSTVLFVVITADQDFADELKNLQEAGYKLLFLPTKKVHFNVCFFFRSLFFGLFFPPE